MPDRAVNTCCAAATSTCALPVTLPDGTLVHPRRHAAPEHRVLDDRAEEQRRRVLVQRAHRRRAPPLEPRASSLQSSYTFSNSEDTTQASTFFSDATNGTTVGDARVHPRLQQGAVRLRHAAQLGLELHWALPFATRHDRRCRRDRSTAGRLSGIWTMRSGKPLTVVRDQRNRSRSQWNPSRGPGIGQDRPSYAPGYGPDNAVLGRPNSGSIPAAFVLQPAGTFGNYRARRLHRPGPAHARPRVQQEQPLGGTRQQRTPGVPSRGLQRPQPRQLRHPRAARLCGQADGEPRWRRSAASPNTITSARQTQVSVRVVF